MGVCKCFSLEFIYRALTGPEECARALSWGKKLAVLLSFNVFSGQGCLPVPVCFLAF